MSKKQQQFLDEPLTATLSLPEENKKQIAQIAEVIKEFARRNSGKKKTV
ncbi:MAG: hypothetical protein ACRDE5_02055 [Ginsengibacter sp.]